MSSSRRRFCLLLLAVAVLGCKRERDAVPSGPPQRIVSQVVDADEILWQLGSDARKRVVGISKMADDPRYSTIADTWPKTVPRIPGTSEALLAAKPDLVIVSEFSAAETRALLESSGVRTLVLSGFDGFEDYRKRVKAIAEGVGLREGGAELIEAFDTKLSHIRVAPRSDAKKVLSWVEGNVAGDGTAFDDVATAAGLRNLAADQGIQGHRNVSLEQVVAWNPEVVVTICGVDDCQAVVESLAERPGWSATEAARSGRIIAIPSAILLSSGAAMLEAVERLRSLAEAT